MNKEFPFLADTQESSDVDLRGVVLNFLSYWRWFVLSVALFFVASKVYLRFQVPIYSVQGTLLIKDDKSSKGGGEDLLKQLNLFNSDKIVENEIEILKSYTLMEKVVRSLGLNVSYVDNTGVNQAELYNKATFKIELITPNKRVYKGSSKFRLINVNTVEVDGKTYPTRTIINTGMGLIKVVPDSVGALRTKPVEVFVRSVPSVVLSYVARLKIINASQSSTVLTISLTDEVPDRGEDVIDKLIEVYNQASIEDKNKASANTLAFINSRLKLISGELSSVESGVAGYKSKEGITDVGEEGKLFLAGVKENDAKLAEVNVKLSILNNIDGYLKSKDKSGTVPTIGSIDNPTLNALVAQLGDLELKKQAYLKTMPESNPIIVNQNDQIRAIRSAISESIENTKRSLNIQKQSLQQASSQYLGRIQTVPTKERGLLDVTRQAQLKNEIYVYLLKKKEETELSYASSVADSRTINEARASLTPVSPVKNNVTIVFILLGFLLPIAVIIIKEVLNNKVTKRSDIEKFLKAPILTEISYTEDESPLLVVSSPRTIVSEQIRALRTNLQFIGSAVDKPKVLLFTSNISGEGKSFVSLNLGASLAMADKKVVILELDLRKPKLQRGLGIEHKVGLSNYLIGQASIDDILLPVPSVPNYYILPSGPIPPNPSEVLMNGRIEILLKELRERFDYVILDAPPVGLVTDAQILGAYADATLFMVRHNYTLKQHLRNIQGLYRDGKFKNLCLILNAIDFQAAYGYGATSGYGYNYGYGYGYGYYSDDVPAKKDKNWFSKIFGKGKN